MPFGLQSAPKLFNVVASVLEWMIINEDGSQVEFVIYYFTTWMICCLVVVLAQKPVTESWTLCQVVGFPVIQEKVLGPATV